jgi:hypothetical protein
MGYKWLFSGIIQQPLHNLKIDPLDLLLKEEEKNATSSNVTVLNPKK